MKKKILFVAIGLAGILISLSFICKDQIENLRFMHSEVKEVRYISTVFEPNGKGEDTFICLNFGDKDEVLVSMKDFEFVTDQDVIFRGAKVFYLKKGRYATKLGVYGNPEYSFGRGGDPYKDMEELYD